MKSEFEYHNEGNEYYKKNEFDKAIECYNKALEICPDLLETYFNRGLAYTRKQMYDKAIKDLNKVIELNPNLAEAYYTRGLVNEYRKDYKSAISDYDTSISLDPTYTRAKKQKVSVYIKILKNRTEKSRNLLDYIKDNEKKLSDGKILKIVSDIKSKIEEEINNYDRPSCNINCSSICCYFTKEPWNYSVMIESKKVLLIEEFLQNKGYNPSDFISRKNWDELTEEDKKRNLDMAKYLINIDGINYIYFPKTDETKTISKEILENQPKTLNNDEIGWISAEAHPCKFVDNSGCMIHRLECNDEIGLNVCREWICMPGYFADVMKQFKIDLGNYDIKKLNNIAESGFRILYEKIHLNNEFRELEESFETGLKDLISASISKNPQIDEKFENFISINNRYKEKIDLISQDFKKELMT